MDRREVLKTIAALSVGAFAVPCFGGGRDRIAQFGALKPTAGQRQWFSKQRTFAREFRPMRGISELGKNVFLWKYLEREIGEIEPHYQGPAEDGTEGEGDCVGQASAMGCDVLAATDIHALRQRERFVAKASVEMNYAGSRVEIGNLGKDDLNPARLRNRAGSHCEWAARWLKEYGVLHRLNYSDGENSLDLTGYHPGRSRTYRDSGVPDWLEPIAREHPVQEYTNVKTGREALDAVCSGQPVLLGSSYAFKDKRDADGFCAPYLGASYRRGWRWVDVRIQWWHAMILTGALLEGTRIGGLVQNSHGDWNSGPRPYDIPRGSFFVELEHLDMMVKDWTDCWALSSYKGHEAKRMRHRLYLR